VRFSATRRPDAIIDVTPMIDIVFQLVLFFMVSTTFVNNPGIQVDLPRSSAQVVISDDEDLNIWMTSEGAIYLNERPVADIDELSKTFQKAAAQDANTMVVIKADVGVTHGRVVVVMDAARQEGLSRLAIATERPDGGSPE
jgi:biopolymer transport protein ExbD